MKIPFALLATSINCIQHQLVDVHAYSLAPLFPQKTTTTAATQLQSATLENPVTSSSLEAPPNKIRPLHQNWFPVSLTTVLKSDRPNAIEFLSQKLVLYQDGGSWKCLADRCSHRFAPLSEGRLVPQKSDDGNIVLSTKLPHLLLLHVRLAQFNVPTMAGNLIQPVNAPMFLSSLRLTKQNQSLHFPVVKNLEWYGYGPTQTAPPGIWQSRFHSQFLHWFVGSTRSMELKRAS